MDKIDFLISKLKVCPKGQPEEEQVIDTAANQGYLLQEKITDLDTIKEIFETLKDLGIPENIFRASDALMFFTQPEQAVVVEFIKGCSKFVYFLDFNGALKIFSILGIPL